MIDLILFAVLVVWLIYLRVHNAKQSGGHTDHKTFSFRAIIFLSEQLFFQSIILFVVQFLQPLKAMA